METTPVSMGQLVATTKKFAKNLLPIGANRMELLLMETREAKTLLLKAVLLAIQITLCGLLACMTITALVVVVFWSLAPVTILVCLSAFYCLAGTYLYCRLASLVQKHTALSATFEQLRQDRAALESFLE